MFHLRMDGCTGEPCGRPNTQEHMRGWGLHAMLWILIPL